MFVGQHSVNNSFTSTSTYLASELLDQNRTFRLRRMADPPLGQANSADEQAPMLSPKPADGGWTPRRIEMPHIQGLRLLAMVLYVLMDELNLDIRCVQG